jgi:hypothetical protein
MTNTFIDIEQQQASLKIAIYNYITVMPYEGVPRFVRVWPARKLVEVLSEDGASVVESFGIASTDKFAVKVATGLALKDLDYMRQGEIVR